MPADYVNKLARMFQDIKVSEDLNVEFKEAHRNNNEVIAGTAYKHSLPYLYWSGSIVATSRAAHE
jgi:hypothetical protein